MLSYALVLFVGLVAGTVSGVVGTGATVTTEAILMVNVWAGPAQAPPVPGATVIVALPAMAPARKLRLPLPLAAKPISVLLLVQV